MTPISKIVFIHSLNNFTGSPNVLSVVIKGFVAKGYQVDLITSRGEGFLSNIKGVNYHYTCYRWLDNKWKTAFLLFFSQIESFFVVLFSRGPEAVYYINTIIPFGAAWACRLANKRFVYHVHENMQQKKPLYALLRWTYKHCNRKSIFVSRYLETTALDCRDGVFVYNGLDSGFAEKARVSIASGRDRKQNILMVASLRRFKGVYEFVKLAKQFPQYHFELVLSEMEEVVKSFSTEEEIPNNLSIYPAQKDLHAFYRRAKLLLQLSHPETCIETFGLSILEAMVYGIPSIVPNVGGPTELVADGVNGFLVNPLDLPDVTMKIEKLMSDDETYRTLSENALIKAKKFSEEKMINEIERYLLK